MTTFKGRKTPFFIDHNLKARNAAGLTSILAELRLKMGEEAYKLTGNRPLADKSMKSYGNQFRGLRYFCSLIGDYESMLILEEKRPSFCPAMSPYMISSFIKFKRLKKGTPLVDNHERPVKDVYGREMVCQGGWNDPDNVKSLMSAVGALHIAAKNSGQFSERCMDCIDMDRREDYHGCIHHRMRPQLWRRGDPRTHQVLKNAVKTSYKNGSGYIAEGDSPLTPWELIQIRNSRVFTGNVEDLQFFVVVILAVKLFLRSDEFLTLTDTSIQWDVSSLNRDGSLKGLAIKIQGKTDPVPVTLMLWADDDKPQLCAVRHLWVYLSMINFKSGYLFPDLRKRTVFSGVYRRPHDYDAFQKSFVDTCMTLFQRDGPFGTHTCRKTSFLLAMWGDAKDVELMTSARHKSLKTSIKYRIDSNLLKHLAKQHQYVSFCSSMPKWKPIYVQSIQLARQICSSDLPQHLRFRSIEQYLSYFLQTLLQFPKTSPNFTQANLLQKAMEHQRTLATTEALDQLLASIEDPELARQIGVALDDHVIHLLEQQADQPAAETMVRRSAVPNLSTAAADGPSRLSSSASRRQSASGARSTRKKRALPVDNGTNDLPRRKQLSNLSGSRKLELIIDLNNEAALVAKDLTQRARIYVSQSLKPVVRCFNEHFNGKIKRVFEVLGEKKISAYQV